MNIGVSSVAGTCTEQNKLIFCGLGLAGGERLIVERAVGGIMNNDDCLSRQIEIQLIAIRLPCICAVEQMTSRSVVCS